MKTWIENNLVLIEANGCEQYQEDVYLSKFSGCYICRATEIHKLVNLSAENISKIQHRLGFCEENQTWYTWDSDFNNLFGYKIGSTYTDSDQDILKIVTTLKEAKHLAIKKFYENFN